jgi:membrane associated rhomboid family serine protease
MVIPYRVDVPHDHRPVMNWFVVAAVVAVFFFQLPAFVDSAAQARIRPFVLDGWTLKGLFGHMWLHAGFFHLIGNLIFLWVFGNAVCSKLGNVLYLPVYVGLGLIAAVSHLILVGKSAVGASGAINGIVGMYLVFFPENTISCFYLFFFRPIFFNISGYWLILFWFAFDLFGAISGSGHVAYVAHVGGFLGGFGLAILMLKKKWIFMEKDEKSIFEMLWPKPKNVPDIPREELEFWRREFKKSSMPKMIRRQSSRAIQSSIKSEPAESKPALHQNGTGPVQKVKVPRRASGFIHFDCSCGQKIQVSREYAGKIGRCPKYSKQVKIPEI